MEMAGLTPASSSLTAERQRKGNVTQAGCVCVCETRDLIGGLTAALHSKLFPTEDVMQEILQF